MDSICAGYVVDWDAVAAIGTLLAVAAALLIPMAQGWISYRRRRQIALQVLPAIADELLWVDEHAERVIRLARANMQRKVGPIAGGLAIGWHVDEDAIDAFDALAKMAFPVFTANGPALANGPGDLAHEVTRGYGMLYRAIAECARVQATAGGSPKRDDLTAFDRSAGMALAASRRTYRILTAFVPLDIPSHWEPKDRQE